MRVTVKNSGATHLEKDFYRGRYSAILARTIDAPQARFRPSELGWIIGALSFLGRIEEAEILFNRTLPSLKLRERIQARFFLGVGCSRQSRYKRARHYFGQNLYERRRRLGDDLVFFLYQGLGFNRYFSGRFGAAEVASTLAFEAASKSGYLYGKALSADIRGHLLVQRGELSAGLRMLQLAQRHARQLGNEAVSDAIEISSLIYGAERGQRPKQDLKTLLRAMKSLNPQDTYSKSNLALEIARQYLLRGMPLQASSTLDQAAELIYATQNRRHEVLLNLRYAHLLLLTGEAARALSFLRLAKKSLDPDVDHSLELSVLGLELKIMNQLEKLDAIGPLRKRIEWMSSIYGNSIQKRMTERALRFKTAPISHIRGRTEDRLGSLINEIHARTDDALQQALETGYYSFLFELLEIPSRSRSIRFELLPGTLTIFDRGEVRHNQGVTPLIRALAVQIANRQGSKRQLVEKIWGYTYHPLRHDPVIYTAMTNFRKLLADRANWIETNEEGYHFAPGVEVRLGADIQKPRPSTMGLPSASLLPEYECLNLRQLKILKYLETRDSIDVRTCRKLFKTSEITASRDLSELNRKRLVVRVGRGRATQYLSASAKLKEL